MRFQYCVIVLATLTAGLASDEVDAQPAGKREVSATSGCTDVDFRAGE